MEYVLLLSGIISAAVLVIFGYALKHKKAYWLISGYNTMSEEKKKNVNVKELAEYMANMLYIMGGLLFLSFLFLFLKLETLGMIFLFILIPFSAFMVVKAQSFDKNTKRKDGTTKTGTKVLIGAVIGGSILIMVGVGILLYFTGKPADFIIQENTLEITGMYGEKIDLKEVTTIELKDELPKILSKTNGSAIGSAKKGYFKLEDLGKVKLFVDTEIPPFIMIQSQDDIVFFNADSQAETEHLYHELVKQWEGSN